MEHFTNTPLRNEYFVFQLAHQIIFLLSLLARLADTSVRACKRESSEKDGSTAGRAQTSPQNALTSRREYCLLAHSREPSGDFMVI